MKISVFLLMCSALNLSLSGDVIKTLAGTGLPGYFGDGAPAGSALLNQPFGVVKGPDGSIYVCDTFNHCIRKISADGTIQTIAGVGEPGYSGDGGLAVEARMNQPYEARIGPDGHLYIVEMINCVVRKVNLNTGVILTVAGTGESGYSGDDGVAILAKLRSPHSIQFSPEGELYVCDIGNDRIRRIDLDSGLIHHFAGSGKKGKVASGDHFEFADLNGPRAIDFDREGNVVLALLEGNAIYRLDRTTATLEWLAGTGESGFSGNGGPAKEATLSGPKGISVGPEGDIYFADTESHSVRKIDVSTGRLELVAGTGEAGDGPEPNPLECNLDRLHGIFVDDHGILIGDTNTHRVRLLQKSN